MPVGPVDVPQQWTLWLTHNDSAPLMFVYCAWFISRSASVSRLFAGLGAVLAATAYVAWLTFVGPVKVEPLPE